jgi:hypothetical protein
MDRVMEEVAAVAADIAVGKMHTAAARKMVEAVAMEATMAAQHTMRNDAAVVSLEVVAKEAAKVAMRELRDGVVVREAEAEAQMYIDDAVAEKSHVVTAAVVASGTSSWLLVDDDETDVKDDDKDEEAEAEAERDAELRAADAAIREATAKRDAEMEARAWQDRYDRRHAEDLAETHVKVEAALAAAEAERVAPTEVKRATHWAVEMDKALTYRRDVDRREACRRTQTERRRTVRLQDAAIRAAMSTITSKNKRHGVNHKILWHFTSHARFDHTGHFPVHLPIPSPRRLEPTRCRKYVVI